MLAELVADNLSDVYDSFSDSEASVIKKEDKIKLYPLLDYSVC